LTTTVDN